MIKTIGYVSETNPYTDKKDWSGLRYKIREAIENAGFEVIWIPYCVNKNVARLLHLFFRIIYGKYFEYKRHPWYLRLCSRSIDNQLINKCEALFFPGQAQIMAFVNVNIPYIYYTDATFCILREYYGAVVDKMSYKYGNMYEKIAIDGCAFMIHASNWSAQIAEKFYECDPEKNYVLQFGANLEETDIVECEVYKDGELNILFSGVDWYRKGAPQAIEAVGELIKMGYNAKLHICGIKDVPKSFQPLPNYVIDHGFLNKNDAIQYKTYINVIKQSHIFLLPTSAECAGIVFCEASAYGLPIFTYDTGGVGDYVFNGVNGYRLSLDSTGQDFAMAIHKSISRNELQRLSEGGRKKYQTDLSWNAWGVRFKQLIKNLK